MPTNRKAIPLARRYFVAPGVGSDANPGTEALPFATFDGGAWPAVAALTNCVATVTYQNATLDTSVSGKTYVLPVGVSLRLSAPWADVGGPGLTATGASTTTSLVVTGSPLAAGAFKGSRVRWTSGTNFAAGSSSVVYSVRANTAGTVTPGRSGFAAAPANGDAFVLERPAGGWSPNAVVRVDGSAAGARWEFVGFLFKPAGAAGHLKCSGCVAMAGLTLDQSTAGGRIYPEGTLYLGALSPANEFNQSVSPLGSPENLAVYLSGDAVSLGLGNTSELTGAVVQATDLVANETTIVLRGASGFYCNGFDLYGTSTAAFVLMDATRYTFLNATMHDAATATPLQFENAWGDVAGATFPASITVDCVLVNGGDFRCSSMTGGNAGAAGKFGLLQKNGCTVHDRLGNTVACGGGAVSVGAKGATAWNGGTGVTVTDMTSAIVTANTSQGCVFWS